MNRIIHLPFYDKFTEQYIAFMKYHFDDKVRQSFIVRKNDDKYSIGEGRNIIKIAEYKELKTDPRIRKRLLAADKIIISGNFPFENYVKYLPPSVWKKVYIQFWGADLYLYRDGKGLKFTAARMIMRFLVKTGTGVINLIDEDYRQFEKIFCKVPEAKHFVAGVPNDPLKKDNFSEFWPAMANEALDSNNKENGKLSATYRILVGNAAYPENQHKEAFEIIRDMKQREGFEGIRVEAVVPLSYGDDAYKEEVMRFGREILGDSFVPVTDYMAKPDYIRFIASCDMAIFNNNRQQALGNICIMMNLGRKVFIRDDTPMWDYFLGRGYYVYNIKDFKTASPEELFTLPKDALKKNIHEQEERAGEDLRDWKNILLK